MSIVKVGIIGLGNMGTKYAKFISNGEIEGAKLAAVCDVNTDRLIWARDTLDSNLQLCSDYEQLINIKDLDAVIIATQHFLHPPIAIKAFQQGLHVLIEKPSGVYTKQVREMNAHAEKSNKVFGIVLNQRTNPIYQKLKNMVRNGELGKIKRTHWTATNWYRTQSYFDFSEWSGTWENDGGGILLNQSIHQLDLWQWTIGMMPKRIRAFCGFGKWRNVSVEDEVTAYVEYENEATGIFHTSISESPGVNRFELVADKGRIVIEDDKMTFWKLRVPESVFNIEYRNSRYGKPEFSKVEFSSLGETSNHKGILQDFIFSIVKGTPLLSPGNEGINSLMLANAMLLSAWQNNWVELPFDDDLYLALHQKQIDRERALKAQHV